MQKTKLNKTQKRARKIQFFNNYRKELSSLKPRAIFYQNFIKIQISGVTCDYYPGAGRIMKMNNGYRKWSDLEPEYFLKLVGISVKKN